MGGMGRTAGILLVLLSVLTASMASAQPGGASTQPAPYPPAPQPYPQPYAQPVAAPPPQLTLDEQRLLARGEIDPTSHVVGGLAGTAFGFGIGQAVQGRYSDTGWIFTLGEAGALTGLIFGITTCFDGSDSNGDDCNDTLLFGSLIAFSVFRIWELVDVWGGPPAHNTKVRNLRHRLGLDAPPNYGFFVVPTNDDGAVGGLTLSF